jgi:hypothetical protein
MIMNPNKGQPWNSYADTDIHVGQGENKAWLVQQGQLPNLASCRLKDHAIAFARAVAFSRRVEMIVHEINGRALRHARPSLTYPVRLD